MEKMEIVLSSIYTFPRKYHNQTRNRSLMSRALSDFSGLTRIKASAAETGERRCNKNIDESDGEKWRCLETNRRRLMLASCGVVLGCPEEEGLAAVKHPPTLSESGQQVNMNLNNRKQPSKRRTASPSPPRAAVASPSTSLLDQDLISAESDSFTLFEDLERSKSNNNNKGLEPRSFPYSVKQQCWEKAEKVKGRDPERWRRDPLGNIVFKRLVGCGGCLCHDYDHIVPYSKGGKSTLENCQVLQATANRSKGNQTDLSRADLIRRSSYCRVSGRDMDLIELAAYGNVRHAEDSGGCKIQ